MAYSSTKDEEYRGHSKEHTQITCEKLYVGKAHRTSRLSNQTRRDI